MTFVARPVVSIADSVAFTARRGPWEVTKTLQWPQSGFELSYTVQVKNTSQQALTGELQLHHNRAIDPNFEHAPSFFGGVGNQSRAACFVDEKLHKPAGRTVLSHLAKLVDDGQVRVADGDRPRLKSRYEAV